MPRYIDADLMTADIQRYLCANCSIRCTPAKFKNSTCEIAECLRMIDNAPTADVEPVRHGRWVKIDDYVVTCSECGRLEKRLDALSYPHCHCGAKMDGDNNG